MENDNTDASMFAKTFAKTFVFIGDVNVCVKTQTTLNTQIYNEDLSIYYIYLNLHNCSKSDVSVWKKATSI